MNMDSNKKQGKYKIPLAVGAAVLILAAAVLFCWFHFSGGKDNSLWYEGDPSGIKKSNTRKAEFIIGVSDVPETNAPLREEGHTAKIIAGLVYEPLLCADFQGNIEKKLAKEVKFSEDGLTAEVTLRHKKFSDGSSVTAEAVIRAYEYLNASDSAYDGREKMLALEGMEEYQSGANRTISGIQKKSKSTLSFTFRKPSVQNLEALMLPIAVPADDSHPYALGTGPYAFDSLMGQSEAVLAANKEFSEKPEYRKIRFQNMPLEILEEKLKNKDVDMTAVAGGESMKRLKKAGYLDIYRYGTKNYTYLGFRADESKDKKALRRAAAYAVDRKAFQKKAGGLPVNSLFEAADEKEKGAVLPDFSLDQAKKEIKSIGIKNPMLTVLIQEDARSMEEFGLLQNQLSKAGIKTKVKTADQEAFDTQLLTGEGFDCYYRQIPEEPLKILSSLWQEKNQDEQFLKELKKQLQTDCTKTFQWLAEKTADEGRIIPLTTEERYLAVSSDCRDEKWIEYFMN